jgi:hypothetical protein
VTIDQEGVGELVRLAAERSRARKSALKLGICGEHGGDPAAIHFCQSVGLDYVSCSPYRVPIARLAAAQAALGNKPGVKRFRQANPKREDWNTEGDSCGREQGGDARLRSPVIEVGIPAWSSRGKCQIRVLRRGSVRGVDANPGL